MGGSRRRTVADQMEQPMMRNEHIVRAYQAAEQAINPLTGSPWRVIHVDNSVATSGAGTAEAPVNSLAGAQAVANQPFDVIFVHQGNSAVTPYSGGYTFAADNQYLVGQGTAMRLPSECGLVPLWGTTPSSEYPLLANGAGTAITLRNGAVVDHLAVTGSAIGISDGAGLPAGGFSIVNDVQLLGSGPNQRGILIQDLAGGSAQFNFSNLSVQNMTNDGLAVITSAGGDPRVNVTNSTFVNNSNSAIFVKDLYNDGRVYVTNSSISHSGAAGISVDSGQLAVFQSSFEQNGNAGVSATGNSVVQVVQSSFERETIGINGYTVGGQTLDITLTDNRIGTVTGGDGISLSVADQVGAIINANMVGNRLVSGDGTTISGGTIRLTNTGAAWGVITATDPDTVVYDPSFGDIYIKASDSANLSAINNNARIFEVPGQFTWDDITYIPPQPIYDPALVVPLPPQ
ncbi:MAG: right-handed parallel beta-helix repeat-containing protein [Planctomycetia bacterium]|nr:right-handed parallel beta-helix repeat-containing protein [Planctomycetia bacterium]